MKLIGKRERDGEGEFKRRGYRHTEWEDTVRLLREQGRKENRRNRHTRMKKSENKENVSRTSKQKASCYQLLLRK